MRIPALANEDFSIFKEFFLGEAKTVEFRAEFFNLFNQTKFTVPNNNAGDPGSFGRFDGAFPGRVIQYRAKLIF